MRYPKEFWLLFLFLEYCYTHCQEDDLGALLGALNPGIFAGRDSRRQGRPGGMGGYPPGRRPVP